MSSKVVIVMLNGIITLKVNFESQTFISKKNSHRTKTIPLDSVDIVLFYENSKVSMLKVLCKV